MPLTKCAACGNGVSSNAKACPNCGEPVKKPPSRIFMALIAFFGIGLAMTVYRDKPDSAAVSAAATAVAPSYPRPGLSSEAQMLIRASSKDPDSIKFRNEFMATAWTSCGEVNGKNSFGGYTGFKRFIADEKNILMDDGSNPKFGQAWRELCHGRSNQKSIDP